MAWKSFTQHHRYQHVAFLSKIYLQLRNVNFLSSTKLPPPPTRVIGLGDKLPPMRPHSPSSEEDESNSYKSSLNTLKGTHFCPTYASSLPLVQRATSSVPFRPAPTRSTNK